MLVAVNGCECQSNIQHDQLGGGSFGVLSKGQWVLSAARGANPALLSPPTATSPLVIFLTM